MTDYGYTLAYMQRFNWDRYKYTASLKNLLKYGSILFPRAFSFELTEWCNRRCNYCPNSIFGSPKDYMSDEIFDLGLTRLKEISWDGMVTYNGYGEPLSVKNIVDFVRRTKEALPDCLPGVVSNGDYLTDSLAKELVEAGCAFIQITEHPPFSVAWQDRVYNLWCNYPIISVRRLSHNDLINIGGLLPFRTKRRRYCIVPSVGMSITVDGRPRFCCCDYKKDFLLPSIKTHTLKEIWEDKEFRRVRRNLWFGKAIRDVCKDCLAGGKST